MRSPDDAMPDAKKLLRERAIRYQYCDRSNRPPIGRLG
jgi:hypothetical protein